MKQKLIENIAIEDLKNLVESAAPNKIFVVTGKKSYHHSGAENFVQESLKGFEYVRFSDFEQNPKYEDVLRGISVFKASSCDLIIAIGGGSVMDMAKLINTFSHNPQIEGLAIIKNSKRIEHQGAALIAIPTTAGTGSEATHFAVVYHQKKKYSVAHASILPNVVGLNALFTQSQSGYLSACAGLDALSQAIESYWSVGASKASKHYAKEAIQLLIPNLEKVVQTPDKESRTAVLQGSYLAGKAINLSKTTAAHAVSYAFTTYFSIPHGHAVFLTLPKFLTYNYGVSKLDSNDPRGVEYTKDTMLELCSLFQVKKPEEATAFLNTLALNMGIELSIEKLGITQYEDIITSNVNMERLGNNPRNITIQQLRSLLTNKSLPCNVY